MLSIRARYGKSALTGVRRAVNAYRAEVPSRSNWDDLVTLAEVDPVHLQSVLGNRQTTGGVTKAEAIVTAARRLADVGVRHAADVDRSSGDQRRAYCGTRGLGPVTWAYFTMLLGEDGVKADTLVSRFVASAIGHDPGHERVEALVTQAAHQLDIGANALDHSIWRYMSTPRSD
ncbi:hypothetical protein [Gordonia liuliyuniae]|uniref:Uncharacterized protein n=1 Tax=Gordonia liuliyuniae TaxID=2911517 RepID=A0ABS9IR60_9ACTN|nr:hypothetical protein [Gordonia liuliyuniae]MCF8588054.1 hypothetical protein [Gordonia liuliyuniae]